MDAGYKDKTYFAGRAFEDYGIVVERARDPLPEMREAMTARPGGHGSYLDSLTMSPREITLECRYFGDRWHDFDEMMNELSAWLITDSDTTLSLRNNPNQYYMAHFKSYEEGDRSFGIGAFTLTFTASDPVRFANDERYVVIKPGKTAFFDVGGNAEADLKIYVGNPRFSNNTLAIQFDGEGWVTNVLAVSKDMFSGSPSLVYFDCAKHLCRLNETVWGITLNSKWPNLTPGRWRARILHGSGTVTLELRERYL